MTTPEPVPVSVRKRWRAVVLPLAILAVVLLGFVGAVAGPKMVSFNCRAAQSEAKGNLKLLHTLERDFRATHGSYTTDLHTLGFEPRSSQHRYVFGFARPAAAGLPGPAGLDPSRRTVIPNGHELAATDIAAAAPDSTATQDAFVAVAVGIIRGGRDVWQIDADGALENLVNACE